MPRLLQPKASLSRQLLPVCRGLDMPGRVDHVVNFDFPLNAVDYLHRTGRTARAGAPGTITSLVARRDQVLIAQSLRSWGQHLLSNCHSHFTSNDGGRLYASAPCQSEQSRRACRLAPLMPNLVRVGRCWRRA